MALASVLLVVLRDLPLVAGFLPPSNPATARLLLQPRSSPSLLSCATVSISEPCPRSAGGTATAAAECAGPSTFPAAATASSRSKFSWQTRRTYHDRATTSLCSGSPPGSIGSAPASDNRSSSPPAERLNDAAGGGGGGGAGSAPSAVVAAEEDKTEQEEEGASDNSSSTWGAADLITVGVGEGRDRAGGVEQALGYEFEWEAGAPWTEFEDWLVQDTFSR